MKNIEIEIRISKKAEFERRWFEARERTRCKYYGLLHITIKDMTKGTYSNSREELGYEMATKCPKGFTISTDTCPELRFSDKQFYVWGGGRSNLAPIKYEMAEGAGENYLIALFCDFIEDLMYWDEKMTLFAKAQVVKKDERVLAPSFFILENDDNESYIEITRENLQMIRFMTS